MNHNPPWNTGHRTVALSETEAKVAHLVSLGLTDKEIGLRLDISHNTANSHIRRACVKLGLKNRVQLAVHIALLYRRHYSRGPRAKSLPTTHEAPV